MSWGSLCGSPAGGMAEDPRHPWGTGATRYNWRRDVRQVVAKIKANFPLVTCNTYVCHPWCGWGPVSVDVWGSNGRGHAIPYPVGLNVRQFVMELPGEPYIRHTIFEHALWTSFGGLSYWAANDHSGGLRHVHITYWL